jgi:hypothetical protein
MALGFAAALGAVIFGSTGTAEAAVLYTCGHEIHTSYHQGWVVIDYMSGINGRSDLLVTGTMSGPNGEWWVGTSTVQESIFFRTRWGYERSWVLVADHDECWVLLR